MTNYDFHTLGPDDFEILVRDLLNAKQFKLNTGIEFKSFKQGRDQGIDLLYSTATNSHEIVVQIKHYRKTGIRGLIQACSKITKSHPVPEKTKVQKLNPQRYILVTSLELSKTDKDELKKIFDPYVKVIDDIIGNEDLNQLLQEFPEIQKNHYKLWFASTAVLERIVHAEIESRNQYEKDSLRTRIALYVKTDSLMSAWKILKRNNVLIITGDPGAGKTMLAEIISFKLMARGYELNFIYQDPSEIEVRFRNDESKQVFYFDDFLGSISESASKAKSAESILVPVIRRFRNKKNKHLILTTRKFILNEVENRSEKIRRLSLKYQEHMLELDSISNDQKLEMLNKHCFIYDLDPNFTAVITKKTLSEWIINHRNFSPRFFDIFTNPDYLLDIELESYEDFIRRNLENPEEIWRHAFEEQIGETDRILLMTLFSLGKRFQLDEFEKIFEYRMNWESQTNGLRKSIGMFNRSLKRLENGFISIKSIGDISYVAFYSPSIEDFLFLYFSENIDARRSLSNSAYYVEQLLVRTIGAYTKNLKYETTSYSYQKLIDRKNTREVYLGQSINETYFLRFFVIVVFYREMPNWEKNALWFLKQIVWEFGLPSRNRERLKMMVEGAKKYDSLFEELGANFPSFFIFLMDEYRSDVSSVLSLIGIMKDFGWHGANLLTEAEIEEEFQEKIYDILQSYIINETDYLSESVEYDYESFLDEIEKSVEEVLEIIEEEFHVFVQLDYHYFEKDSWEIGHANHIARMVSRDD